MQSFEEISKHQAPKMCVYSSLVSKYDATDPCLECNSWCDSYDVRRKMKAIQGREQVAVLYGNFH